MLKIEICGLKKFFGDREILNIRNLRIYEGEKVAICGPNGCGKTTLLRIIAGELEPDEGKVKVFGSPAYIRQFDDGAEGGYSRATNEYFGVNVPSVYGEYSKIFSAAEISGDFASGGEKTRIRIARAMETGASVLLADEPGANLDMPAMEALERSLLEYDGTLILVSHDRRLLDALCDRVVWIENGTMDDFAGNYSSCRKFREERKEVERAEYQEFVKEKKRLKEALAETSRRSRDVRKTPTRMGNSEARLHTRGVNSVKAKLDRAAKAIGSRIEKLEVKSKPKTAPKIFFDLKGCSSGSRFAVRARSAFAAFSECELFGPSDFDIPAGSKTAVIGPNGCGKTTLLKMILAGDEKTPCSPGIKIGYFSQALDVLEPGLSIYENVRKSSRRTDTFIRTLMARLLFRADDAFKPAGNLSGGERVRASILKIAASECNMIVLDEPTNYLDIYAREALESVLSDYDGTLVMVCHDRDFVANIASRLLIFENKRIVTYEGGLAEYERSPAEGSKVCFENDGKK